MRQLISKRFPLLLGPLSPRQTRAPIFGGWGAIIGLFILFLFFSVFSPPFLQQGNLILIARNAAITIGIVAVGQTVVLISGGIDVSLGSMSIKCCRNRSTCSVDAFCRASALIFLHH